MGTLTFTMDPTTCSPGQRNRVLTCVRLGIDFVLGFFKLLFVLFFSLLVLMRSFPEANVVARAHGCGTSPDRQGATSAQRGRDCATQKVTDRKALSSHYVFGFT